MQLELFEHKKRIDQWRDSFKMSCEFLHSEIFLLSRTKMHFFYSFYCHLSNVSWIVQCSFYFGFSSIKESITKWFICPQKPKPLVNDKRADGMGLHANFDIEALNIATMSVNLYPSRVYFVNSILKYYKHVSSQPFFLLLTVTFNKFLLLPLNHCRWLSR